MEIFGKKWEIKKNPKRIIFFIILILIGYWYYQDSVEQQNRAIDEYNFQQLKGVKSILESIPENSGKFYTLKEFNHLYNANVEPKKDCYYVSNVNGDKRYIFGFKLYSELYRQKYKRFYYASVSYDLPYDIICAGYCYDRNMELFLRTISHPCEN